jgi:hypothetical protein
MAQTPSQVEQAWLDLFARRASTVITNIAGPKEPVAIAGVPLSGFVAWVPCTGPIGVGLSVCSYAGELVLGVAVDRSLVPDSDVLLEALKDEFEAVLLSGDEQRSRHLSGSSRTAQSRAHQSPV